MLHIGQLSSACKTCLPIWGLKIVLILVVGSIIGYQAMDFVEEPFSTHLILDKSHTSQTNNILTALNIMSDDISVIKDDIQHIKTTLKNDRNDAIIRRKSKQDIK